jgi:hypothetical protein
MSVDDTLVKILATGRPTDIPAVLQRMRDIEEVLPYTDGLKWFTMLYGMVTQEILDEVKDNVWADGPWLQKLDVEFANLYFDALRTWLTDPSHTPRAWIPLFEARHRQGIVEVQYELAGMNAHINRDLPVAVLATCLSSSTPPVKGSPQHQDFLRVNDILSRVEVAVRQMAARGLIDDLVERLETLDDVLAMWSISKARDSAWTSAEVLWSLQPSPALAGEYLTVLDRAAGFAGRGLLVRTGCTRGAGEGKAGAGGGSKTSAGALRGAP